MTPFLRKLLGQNWLLLLTMLALAVFGVVAIYSATSTRADSNAVDFWRKQANWVVVGVFAFMLTSLIHYRWIRWEALPMYLAVMNQTRQHKSKDAHDHPVCLLSPEIHCIRVCARGSGAVNRHDSKDGESEHG